MVPVIPEILRSKVVVLAELFRKRRELQQANLALKARERRASSSASTNRCARPTTSWRRATASCARKSPNARVPRSGCASLPTPFLRSSGPAPPTARSRTPTGTGSSTTVARPKAKGPSDLTRLVLHPDDSQGVHDLVVASLAAGDNFEFEARHRSHDGEYCWFMTRAVPWRDDVRAGRLLVRHLHQRARDEAADGTPARGRPAQGRIPCDAGARAAQSAGAAAQCAERPPAGLARRVRAAAGPDGTPARAAGAADRRPARHRAHHPRQARPAQGRDHAAGHPGFGDRNRAAADPAGQPRVARATAAANHSDACGRHAPVAGVREPAQQRRQVFRRRRLDRAHRRSRRRRSSMCACATRASA